MEGWEQMGGGEFSVAYEHNIASQGGHLQKDDYDC